MFSNGRLAAEPLGGLTSLTTEVNSFFLSFFPMKVSCMQIVREGGNNLLGLNGSRALCVCVYKLRTFVKVLRTYPFWFLFFFSHFFFFFGWVGLVGSVGYSRPVQDLVFEKTFDSFNLVWGGLFFFSRRKGGD